MIRRDYILRLIEEFAEALARIRALKKDKQLNEASSLTESEFKRITGLDSESVLKLSETELLARLIQSEPLHAVREKMYFLTTLLKETGDIAAAEGRAEESRACYLKGLHLLLDSLARGDAFEQPESVPKVELFVGELDELPVHTNVLLMEHYERIGQFGKAEDCLFAVLEADPKNVAALEFGISFYQRLLGQSDVRLAEGNLPREEVEAGLAELSARK
jgi:tetratricopeptide (TPR) repeat protein